MPLSPGMCWLPMPPAMVNPRPLEPLNSSTSISSSVWVIPWELGYLRRLMARTTLFPARFKASTDTEWLTLTTDTSFTWNKLTTDVKKLPRHCYNFGKIEAKLTSWNLFRARLFQNDVIRRKIEIFSWNQLRVATNILDFQWKKARRKCSIRFEEVLIHDCKISKLNTHFYTKPT